MDKGPFIGAFYLGNERCRFNVWAPYADRVEVRLYSPEERSILLEKDSKGYHGGVVGEVPPGTLYRYCLDGNRERPDPASRFQPQGVHGPSRICDPRFDWQDGGWEGLKLKDYIIYELHVGTFTPEGTLEAVIPHLEDLKDLGVTALEIMPVAQFPGSRNWGYDGVYPFAVQESYGGPEGLKKLVNACHRKGLSVVLDVVYNHLGPEGNYLEDFGPYFTSRYRTSWGKALNFDGPDSDEVRRFFIENALSWITDYHIDALRLDALHAILDISPYPFLTELAETVWEESEKLSRKVFLMGESDLNDVRLLRSRSLGGSGLDVVWNDDFHHALHTVLTGEQTGYYRDFGQIGQLAKAFQEGFVYSGQYAPYRKRRHGSDSKNLPVASFLVFSQNHDQIGNRLKGDRLTRTLSFEALKLAAGTVLLSTFVPLLFMGEEYGETAPFQYFVSHSDPALIEGVRQGRREEFAAFGWEEDPPDPQSEETFLHSRLHWELSAGGQHKILKDFYRELIRWRRELTDQGLLDQRPRVNSHEDEKILEILYEGIPGACLILFFGERPKTFAFWLPKGRWSKKIDSSENIWQGTGSRIPAAFYSDGEISITLNPHSCLLLLQDKEN